MIGFEEIDRYYKDLARQVDDLKRDKARLDWLESMKRGAAGWMILVSASEIVIEPGEPDIEEQSDEDVRAYYGDTIAAAIDAAMKGER